VSQYDSFVTLLGNAVATPRIIGFDKSAARDAPVQLNGTQNRLEETAIHKFYFLPSNFAPRQSCAHGMSDTCHTLIRH